MRVITNRRLLDFAVVYADAGEPLQSWRKVMEVGDYANFAELRQTFRGVDKVGVGVKKELRHTLHCPN